MCNDSFLLSINQKYLSHDYFTDIISFDYSQEKIIEGELYISIERVFENAGLFKQNKQKELHRVIIHGVLHLLGYKDKLKSQIETMRFKEDYYLQIFDSINNVG